MTRARAAQNLAGTNKREDEINGQWQSTNKARMSHPNSSTTQSVSSDSIYSRLDELLQDVFDNDNIVVTPELNASHVEGWDSMGNVRLFLAIEQEFGVRFNASEISGIENLGGLVALLERKLNP